YIMFGVGAACIFVVVISVAAVLQLARRIGVQLALVSEALASIRGDTAAIPAIGEINNDSREMNHVLAGIREGLERLVRGPGRWQSGTMTALLALSSLVCVATLVATVCVFVHRLVVMLRAADDAVRSIAADTHRMVSDGAAISPGIGSMNQNLYRVAMHLGQL